MLLPPAANVPPCLCRRVHARYLTTKYRTPKGRASANPAAWLFLSRYTALLRNQTCLPRTRHAVVHVLAWQSARTARTQPCGCTQLLLHVPVSSHAAGCLVSGAVRWCLLLVGNYGHATRTHAHTRTHTHTHTRAGTPATACITDNRSWQQRRTGCKQRPGGYFLPVLVATSQTARCSASLG